MNWQWIRPPKNKPQTYILPTRFGLSYGVALVLMLMIAFGYSNNLVFFVCFFLTSFGLVSMLITNQNIKHFNLLNLSAKPFFADALGEALLQVRVNSKSDLQNIQIQAQNSQRLLEEVPAQVETLIPFPLQKTTRGRHRFPALRIESHYPFQLCRSWKTIRSSQEYLVYPSRLGSSHFPRQGEGPENEKQVGKKISDDDFAGFKPYGKTDSPRRIDWKATARSNSIQVKIFESSEGQNLVFTWEQTHDLDSFEARLSQLALWVDLAERSGHKYQVILPGFQSHLSRGSTHWQECLTALALMEPQHVSA